ncbi:MAG: hypothetical protein WBM68_12835 [Woeseia sp.]
MPLRLLPLVTGLLPIIGIHASYLIAVQFSRVPACLPYFSGCTSISSTGRHPPASYLFKAVMLPEAILLMAFWICCAGWLQALEGTIDSRRHRGTPQLVFLGCSGAFALILYVTFLGTHEAFYEFMRRFGIYMFFLLTMLAQLDLSLRFRYYAVASGNGSLRPLSQLLLVLVALPFVLGALNLTLKAVLANPDPPENAIEWIVVLLMQSHIALTYFAWRATGFKNTFSVSGTGRP